MPVCLSMWLLSKDGSAKVAALQPGCGHSRPWATSEVDRKGGVPAEANEGGADGPSWSSMLAECDRDRDSGPFISFDLAEPTFDEALGPWP